MEREETNYEYNLQKYIMNLNQFKINERQYESFLKILQGVTNIKSKVHFILLCSIYRLFLFDGVL